MTAVAFDRWKMHLTNETSALWCKSCVEKQHLSFVITPQNVPLFIFSLGILCVQNKKVSYQRLEYECKRKTHVKNGHIKKFQKFEAKANPWKSKKTGARSKPQIPRCRWNYELWQWETFRNLLRHFLNIQVSNTK